MNISPRFIVEDDDPGLLGRFTVWTEKVVDNAKKEYFRTQKYRNHESPIEQNREAELSYEDPMPSGKDEFDIEEEKLSAAFSKLNMLRQKMLTLIFVEGLTAQETADRLGCSIEYVYLQKHRTLKALRDQLMEEGGRYGK